MRRKQELTQADIDRMSEQLQEFADSIDCIYNDYGFPFNFIRVNAKAFVSNMLTKSRFSTKNCLSVFKELKREWGYSNNDKKVIEQIDHFYRFQCFLNFGLSHLTVEFSSTQEGITDIYFLIHVGDDVIGLVSKRCYTN